MSTDRRPGAASAVVRPERRTPPLALIDRIGYWLCWATGVALCMIALAIVLFMFVKGIAYLRPSLFVQSPSPSLQQSKAGGFFDPLVGTFIITAIGTAIAAPTGVASPRSGDGVRSPGFACAAVESAIDVIAGVPSVVLAIFGLLVFSEGFRLPLPARRQRRRLGRSFFAAGIVMALVALPLIVGSTREALRRCPTACARRPTRSARPGRHDPLRAAPCDRVRTSPAASRWAWAASSATRRSSILLGVTLPTEGSAGCP